MKKLIFIILLIYTSFSLSQDKKYRYINDCDYFEHTNSNSIEDGYERNFIWDFYQTSTTSQITDVQFFIHSIGLATHTGMGVTLTTNSGLNWTSISFNDTTFTTSYNGIYFINNLTGWAVGGSMQIRKTTNGGLNWTRQIPPPLAGVLNSIYFFNSSTGLAIGRKTANYNSCILRTTNAGINWNEVIASTANENELSCQFWFNENTGWMCGRSILLKSTNGGLNYTNYYSSVPPTSNGINALLSLYFEDQQTGWIGSSNLDHKNIYKTTNGGLNWIFQDNPVAQNTYTQINDIIFIDQNWGWAAHGTPSSGAILFTTNGGTNWVLDNGTNTWYDCLWTYNDAIVYCGAAGGKIWYSGIPSGKRKTDEVIPDKFALYQNYPNPFNSMTNIKLEIPNSSNVKLAVYDLSGKEIFILVNEKLHTGIYKVTWNASEYSSGVYFYKLEAGNFVYTRKMILIK